MADKLFIIIIVSFTCIFGVITAISIADITVLAEQEQ